MGKLHYLFCFNWALLLLLNHFVNDIKSKVLFVTFYNNINSRAILKKQIYYLWYNAEYYCGFGNIVRQKIL